MAIIDTRTPMKKGAVLGEAMPIVLGDCIGKGGYSLCYEGFLTEQENRKVILKEIYPYKLAMAELIHRDPETQLLRCDRDLSTFYAQQAQEQEIIMAIRNPKEGNTPYILQMFTVMHQNIPYAVIDTSGGDMLHRLTAKRTEQGAVADLPTLADVLERVNRILEAVAPIHDAGYIHGDISPDNLFVSQLEQNDQPATRTIQCIDFNSAFLAAEVQGHRFTSKPGFSPAEFRMADQKSCVSFGSDLFSIGAILFEMLYKTHYDVIKHKTALNGDLPLPSVYLEGQTVEVKRGVQRLLRDSLVLRMTSEGRRPAHRVMKDAILHILKLLETPHRLVNTYSDGTLFTVGRQAKCEEIYQGLCQRKTVALRGIGGIGKSHLAKFYANQYRAYYDAVMVLPYLGSVKSTILSDKNLPITNFTLESVLGLSSGDATPTSQQLQRYFDLKLEKLNSLLSQRVLLVIDGMNATQIDEEEFRLFAALDCGKIITTRADFSERYTVQQVNVPEIGDVETLKKLFFKYYPQQFVSQEKMAVVESLIVAVQCHTLTVMLIAKSAMASDIDLRDLLANVQGVTQDLPKEPVKFDYDGLMINATVDIIMQTVFDFVDLSDAQQDILRHLCLFPDTGIVRSLFKQWMGLEDFIAVNRLIDSGWITFSEETNTISLHQAIADVCRKKLKPSCDKCGAFLKQLTQYANNTNLCTYEAYAQGCHLFQTVTAVLPQMPHPLLHAYVLGMARLHLAFDDFGQAELIFSALDSPCCDGELRYMAQSSLLTIAVEKRNKTQAEALIATLAQSPYLQVFKDRELIYYQNKAWFYMERGDQASLQYAIEICEEALAKNPPKEQLSMDIKWQIYHYEYILANGYYRMAKYTTAPETYYTKASKAVENAIENKERDFANRPNAVFAEYNLLASCQFHLGKLTQAYHTQQALLEKKKKYFPPHVRTMAVSYRNLAQIGYALYEAEEGVHVDALRAYLKQGIEIAKALDLQEMVFFLYDIQLSVETKECNDGAFLDVAIAILELTQSVPLFYDEPKGFYEKIILPKIQEFIERTTIDTRELLRLIAKI
ncbi:hypothetical protein RFF05_13225 [Bengtsoniella intestinalis]|uniref:protein kinase domain-containing protein n=1 Tax=Bengtsoniella intestinalis TaxID=3073143 RepID=UPI00391F459B